MNQTVPNHNSPRWSSTTKLVVALTIVGFLAMILVNFRNLIGPLLLAFVIAYLLYPVCQNISKKTHISWRLTVTLVYLLFIIILIGLIVWGGIALVEQIQSLVNFLQNSINDIPKFIEQWSSKQIVFGPFVFDLAHLDLTTIGNQVLGYIQPVLSQTGSIVGTFASSAASTLGWMMFVLLVSYFILAESEGTTERLINLQIPGYQEDVTHMVSELGYIWNAFLRGQIIIIAIVIATYTITLGALNVRYYFGLAVLAGLARFVPYVGPAVAWTTYGLVSYFQGYTPFGINPLIYAAIVVGVAWVTDLIMDNYVTPRLMANALKVHPAAVMVAALISLNWFGMIGVILAAPVLATLKLILDYAFRKLLDQDPWVNLEHLPRTAPIPISEQIRLQWEKIRSLLKKLPIQKEKIE